MIGKCYWIILEFRQTCENDVRANSSLEAMNTKDKNEKDYSTSLR
jgi:hypothetical protein